MPVNWRVILLVLVSNQLLIVLAFHLLCQKEKAGRRIALLLLLSGSGEDGLGRGSTCSRMGKLPMCVMLFREI